MAVTVVNEVGESREGIDDQQGVVLLARSFEVFTNSTLDDEVVVLSSASLPALFAVYVTASSSFPRARCIRRTARQHSESPWKWSVTCNYSTRWLDEARANPDPTLRPAQISFSSRQYTKALTTDLDGVAVVNVNKETFDPPPSKTVYRLTMRISRFESALDPIVLNGFIGALNDRTFFAFDQARARCNDIQSQSANEGEVSGWQTTYTFEFLNDNEDIGEWQAVLLSQGYKERTGGALVGGVVTGGTIKKVLEDGHPPSRPVLLDALGAKLDLTTDPVTPVYTTFTIAKQKNFDDLNLL